MRSSFDLPIAVGDDANVNHKSMPSIPAAERALRFLGLPLVRLLYRVQTVGQERLPRGGFLLLPNHITWVDALILLIACPRPIRFMIAEEFYRNRWLHPFLHLVRCIPITPRKAKDAMRLAAEMIRDGEIVCVFPEGELTRSGVLGGLRRGYELIARQAEAPVVPVWLDQLWGSIFSFQGGRFFLKWPRHFPYPAMVEFGAPLSPNEADAATVREQLLKLAERCFNRRPALRVSLGVAAVRGLARHPFQTAVIEGMDGSSLSKSKLLGAAAALSRYLRRECPEKRIAIVLPASKAGVLANLAVVLAGSVPVGLNFTSGRDALLRAQEIAGLTTAISAKVFGKRLPDFPWPARVIQLDELLPKMKRQIFFWWLAAILLPAGVLVRLLGLAREGDHEEAVLLFTSGSSGDPKGVILSHRNLVGNVSQFRIVLEATTDDLILASLPFFHSFGCTVTLWFPLIDGVRVVTYPNPLEAAKCAELIEQYRVTVVLAAPTFLRGYLRKAKQSQFATVRLTITGAEKLPRHLAETFEEKLGKQVFEGYGLTETSPVVSVNLPDPVKPRPGETFQPGSRAGSVGKLVPGLAAEIRDPETGAKLSLHEPGMLWLRGPNIFEGYLDDPQRTGEVLQEGWLKTGDLARFDEDGFLFIQGRLSRFSKIGGEMVPHETVEQKVAAALALSPEGERVIAIASVADEQKGETLVLLAAIPIDQATLRTQLQQAGVPNLWIPKTIRRVEKIPVLATGKLDLRGCAELAARPDENNTPPKSES
jgi:acyl-[acyl-carrier-protein]-phospholipid O-acyltransferase/long-chain-fatty-acid--[acyl-carrier-protein] ligase